MQVSCIVEWLVDGSNPNVSGLIPIPIDPDLVPTCQAEGRFKPFKPDDGPPDSHYGSVRHDLATRNRHLRVEDGKHDEDEDIDRSHDWGCS